MITHCVGLSLGANSGMESGVAVREITTGKIIYMDKLFSVSDIELFFENYNNLKNSIFCISLPWDSNMLEGKWRILSKPYQLIHSNNNFLNKDNWMQRFSSRGCELFTKLSQDGIKIYRYEIYLTRQKLDLYSNYKEHSPADCKFLQNRLRTEWGLDELPLNMVPAAQLEAIVGTILAQKIIDNQTKSIFEFKGLTVVSPL